MKQLFFVLLALGATSCLNVGPDTCQATLLAPVKAATGPRTVAAGQPAVFTLNYEAENGCGTLAGLPEQANATTNTQTVGINVSYTTCSCATAATPAQTTYTFKAPKAGTYYLKFISVNGYVTDTLVVQ